MKTSSTPSITLKSILKELGNVHPLELQLVTEAYEFAKEAHGDQKRLSGEPHLVHLLATAYYLAEIGMEAQVVAAGLLHDTLEDTSVTLIELETAFGDEIAFLVQGVTRLGEMPRAENRHAETLRRLLISTAQDIRVIIIKLYDRLHNMQTNSFHIPERRLRKARETLEIYAPIAERLGMGRVRRDLEDLAFPYVNPDAYKHMCEIREYTAAAARPGLMQVEKTLIRAFKQRKLRGVKTDIREKGLWSLYQKIKRKGDAIQDIHDTLAIRIIVPDIESCYAALGIVHGLYKTLPGQFKDYIGFPKPNGYQSLHTTVIGPEAGIFEVQIRSEEMHQQAELGIVSHFTRKKLVTV